MKTHEINIVVIVNHEKQPTNFKVHGIIAGTVVNHIDTYPLQPGEKWDGKISLILKNAGDDQKIEFYLYKGGEKEPYFKEPLFIYIDVRK